MSGKTKILHMTASAAYLAALAFALWRALPWLTWGVQPEYALSAFNLAASPSTATSLFIILSKLSGGIAGHSSFEFSINAAAAIAFALCCAAAYFTGAAIGGATAAALCSFSLFAAAAAWSKLFISAGPLPIIILLLLVAILCAAHAFNGGNSTRAFILAAFVFGAGASQHSYLAAAAIAFAAYTAFRWKDTPRNPAETASAILTLAAAASLPLLFLFLRPRVSVIWGPSWPATFLQAMNIPTIADFGKTFEVKIDPALLAAPLMSMIDRPWAPYFPAFAMSLIGIALAADKRRSLSAPMLILMVLPLTTYSLTPSRSPEFFLLLMACGLAAAFAAACAESFKSAPSFSKYAAIALCAFAVFPLIRGVAGASTAAKSATNEYTSLFTRNLRRDAIIFIEDSAEPRYALNVNAAVAGLRPDVTVLHADRFADARYRRRLRALPGLKTLTEKQYAETQLATSELTRKTEDQGISDAVKDTRSRYNLMMLVQQVTVVENAARAPIYFDTVQRFLKSRVFNKMSFEAAGATIKYRNDALETCIEDQLWQFAAAGNIKRFPEDRRDAQKLVKRTAEIFSSLAMSCDASPGGYRRACLLANARIMRLGAKPQSKASVGEVLDNDFRPLPEITTYCFTRKYFLSVEEIERAGRDTASARILRDPEAASIISAFYTDLGEYSYLHIDSVRDELDKMAADAKGSAGKAAFIYKAPLNTAWLFETAEKIDPANARAHLFLVLLYEAAAMHARASEEADTLLSLLTRKEQTGKMDEYYYFMLQELYTRLGRPSDAQKYSKLITGGNEQSLLP